MDKEGLQTVNNERDTRIVFVHGLPKKYRKKAKVRFETRINEVNLPNYESVYQEKV